MQAATLPLEVLRAASVLHVSGISQAISANACDAVFAAIEAATAAGARLSYDPNLRLKLWPLARARAIIAATAARCHWFLPSLDEIRTLSGLTAPDALIDWCHALGAPVVALKCGRDGVVVSDGHRRERFAGHAVDPVDATGAGDCFDGAFAARTLAGDDPFAAARYANAAAALATTGFGAVAPLPRDAAVRRLLGGARP
jgi:2-dehydro-3-deoxygluconokinase